MKRSAFLWLSICVLFCLSSAKAEKAFDFWVRLPEMAQSETTLGEVRVWTRGSTRYLFLPAVTQDKPLQVHTSLAGGVAIDGELLQAGSITQALIPGTTVNITLGKRNYPIHIMQGSQLPAMWIATQKGSLEKIHASTKNVEPAQMLLLDAEGNQSYQGALTELRGRGNATFAFDKKPYQIKLAEKTSLLHMGKARTWVLLAEYNDYSMMRNKITFDLAAQMGMDYVSQAQWLDLYIDGDYKGVYLLAEKVHVDAERVDIDDLEKVTEGLNEQPLDSYKMKGATKVTKGASRGYQIPENPADISGGYLLEIELPYRYPGEPSGFVTNAGQPVVIKAPEYASMEQLAYISNFIQGYENAISAEDGIDPQSGKHYSEFIDMDSLVKKYLLEELAKNVDANKSSQYYYKPADSQSPLAFAGPVWDYDSAYGNFARSYNPRFASPDYLAAAVETGELYYWWPKVYAHEDFRAHVTTVFHEQMVPALRVLLGEEKAEGGSLCSLDEYEQQIFQSAEMNRIRWPHYRRQTHSVDTGKTLAENVDFLERFIGQRMVFLLGTWPQ